MRILLGIGMQFFFITKNSPERFEIALIKFSMQTMLAEIVLVSIEGCLVMPDREHRLFGLIVTFTQTIALMNSISEAIFSRRDPLFTQIEELLNYYSF